MGFVAGDQVLVAHFGTGVVREVRNGGRYLVEVRGAAMVVTAIQLKPAAALGPRRRRRDEPPETSRRDLPSRTTAPSSLDLHGRTTAEAVVLLDEFLNEAMLAGLPEVRVIHGRSGGRVKAAVHARLKALRSVRWFRLDPANVGVTVVGL